MRFIIFVALTLFSTLPAFADTSAPHGLDAASSAALNDTQVMMNDPKAIAEYAKTHPDAAAANSQVNSLTNGNSADSAAVYKLASEIFSNMAKESNGDGAGMQATLSSAMKNPQAFAEKLSPEQRQQLQQLTKSIESRSPTSSPH